MLSRSLSFVFVLLLAAPLCLFALIPAETVDRVRAAVVQVDVGDDGYGTGFLVSRDGLIITNAHVVPRHLPPATINFADGRSLEADFVSFDPRGLDLAAFQLPQSERGRRRTVWPFLEVAPANAIREGNLIFSAGFPYPLYPSLFAHGMVSHLRATHNVLVHTIPTTSGSSGSPVFTAAGQVVGVITEMLLDEDISGYSEARSGFNVAIDRNGLAKFIAALGRGERERTRMGHLTFLRMPLPKLELGRAVTANLTADSDRLVSDLSFVQGYTVELTEGTTYRIRMSSSEVDAYLLLYDSAPDLIMENDDAEGEDTTDAEIIYTATANDRYLILATTFAAGETGTYTLLVQETVMTEVMVQNLTLHSDLAVDDRGAHFRDVPFVVPATGTYWFEMKSDDLDSYLFLYDADMNLIDQNDDAHDNTVDSRIVYTAQEGERLILRTSTFFEGSVGAFTLNISTLD